MDDIDIYLKEDLSNIGDITSEALFSNEKINANIICRERCVVAGLKEAKDIFNKLGVIITLLSKDGNLVKKETIVAKLSGPAKSILKGERLALNIICRMSGIATETKKLIEKCKKINPNISITSTRKTTPGFRKYEKKAVLIGGGELHRFGLYDAVLIKDNHIKIIGSVEKAIKKMKETLMNNKIEIEVENEKDAITAAKLTADIIMLDNFSPKEGKIVAEKIRKINPNIIIEISGGVTQENITDYASFADRISLGYLTHSIKSADFSLEVI